jgi:hypothetical protein
MFLVLFIHNKNNVSNKIFIKQISKTSKFKKFLTYKNCHKNKINEKTRRKLFESIVPLLVVLIRSKKKKTKFCQFFD